LEELNTSVAEFKNHYEQFARQNPQFIRIDDSITAAIEKAAKLQNAAKEAEKFGNEISAAICARESKQRISDFKWTGKLCKFLEKVYPIAEISLHITRTVAGVLCPWQRFHSF